MDEHVATTYCRTLVDEWVHLGITDAVIAPGSRSTPMALALAEAESLGVHVHHDERSAAFVALGLGLASGRPAIVLTTSGTAAVELHPAVVEAHQACVPLLVLTADRPPELQGVGAPQTIDQRELYGTSVRWFCDPGPPEPEHREMWRQLAFDAWSQTVGIRPGPVHLNLAFREPLLDDDVELADLPPRAVERRVVMPTWGILDEQLARLVPVLDSGPGVIVAGARAAVDEPEVAQILALAERLGWPVLADASSGCRVPHPAVVAHSDALLRVDEVAQRLRPRVVLRFGGLLASRITNEWLASTGAVQLGFDRYGVVPDPDRVLADTFHVSPALAATQLLSGLAASGRQPAPGALEEWRRVDDQAAAAIAASLGDSAEASDAVSEPDVARVLLGGLPHDAALVVSSSMPIRDLEWYAPPRAGVRVLANRGANGIDGVVSTAAGVALAGAVSASMGPRARTACLVGDVAFLHDTTAMLGLRTRGLDLLVVVVDNDGGGIFSFLPQATALASERFEQLFGTPHGVDLPALVGAHGLDVATVGTRTELADAIGQWAESGGTRVVIVPSDRGRNLDVHRALNAAVATALT